ncbi:MAG: SH3 domain-containing protein [Nocardioidaceae bacterium]
MTHARHTATDDRPRRRPFLRLAPPVLAAALLSSTVVAVAVTRADDSATDPAPQAAAPVTPAAVTLDPADSPYLLDRDRAVSRSASRVTLRKKPAVKAHKFRTAPLNLWTAPREKGKPLAVLPRGGKVAVTGVRKARFAQILHGGQLRWVNAAYLADRMPKPKPAPKPAAKASASSSATTVTRSHRRTTPDASSSRSAPRSSGGGVSGAPCADGSATERGLTSSAVRLYRGVCNAFPALSSYGGWDAHGEHSGGKAIDFMVSDAALGQAVAEWARAHASQLGLFDVIWAQRIWTPVRSGEGWRSMSDRGSATANHYDHVHIAVN